MARQVSRRGISDEDREAALERIAPAETLDALADCDLVIEAATEKEDDEAQDLHRAVPAPQARRALSPPSTSSISITRLAAATDRPERFIGIHFMNPVPLMKLVEIIRGIATDDATYESAESIRRQARWARPRPTPRISPPSSSTASWCR